MFSELLSEATRILKYAVYVAIVLPIILAALHYLGVSPSEVLPVQNSLGTETFYIQGFSLSETLRILSERVKDFL